MVKPGWMDDDFAHEVMRYSLIKASMVAARHEVYLCAERDGTCRCHGPHSSAGDGGSPGRSSAGVIQPGRKLRPGAMVATWQL